MADVLRINGERWLVCGGRDFADQAVFDGAMGDLMRHFGCPAEIVHGAARGADSMADALGARLAVTVRRFPADWQKHGRAAGIIRNREMLATKPDKVVAFPGGRGTANMVEQARGAGIAVVEIRQG